MTMTDKLDTVAIRAQYSDGEYLDAYPGEACATILALCDETERLRAENERLREAAEHFATWDQGWPGNINLEVACKKIRAALAQKMGG